MSSLNDVDKRYLVKVLRMEGGYVLDYSDAAFGEFFSRHNIDVHGRKYQTYGPSKAKKLRAFWEQEPDAIVAPVLSEMLDSCEADRDLNGRELDAGVLEKCRTIVARLSGKPLLEYLMRHAGRVVTKTMILEHVYDFSFDPQTNVVDVLVSRLRQKVDRDFPTKMIQTLRGVGYVLKAV
jgi:hypothetical protein